MLNYSLPIPVKLKRKYNIKKKYQGYKLYKGITHK